MDSEYFNEASGLAGLAHFVSLTVLLILDHSRSFFHTNDPD
jgi:hypothetical protein